MSARETVPLQSSLSPSKRDDNREENAHANFKRFNNPALGISVSCSLAQLADLRQMLTPTSADQAPQAPFFTPFSNKTYDSAQVSDSVVFYSAMDTGLRSSQSANADPNGSVHSRLVRGKALFFGDGLPTGCAKANGSRPSSNGSGIAAVGPSKLANIAALNLRTAVAAIAADEEAAGQAAAAISSPVAGTPAPQLPAREPQEHTDNPTDNIDGLKSDIVAQDPACMDADVQPNCSGCAAAGNPSPDKAWQGDAPCLAQLAAATHSPATSDEGTIQAFLPTALLVDGLLEKSGETSGRKPSPGPADSTHAQGQPPIVSKREKSYGTTACMPRLAHASAASGATITARKVPSSATPSRRQRADTPASSTKLPTSGKQSQARTGKASTAAATTPGRQSSQKPRRSSSVPPDATKEAAPQMGPHTTPPRSTGMASAKVLPAGCNASDAKAGPVSPLPAEDHVAAGTGTGTPWFVKRVRPALGTSPSVTPFSAIKCPLPVHGMVASSTAAALLGAGAAVLQGKAQAQPEQQRTKRPVRVKAPTAVPAGAKAVDLEEKAGQETKAVAGDGRSGVSSNAAGVRRNSSVSGGAKNTGVGKPSSAHAAPAATKTAPAAAGIRAARANATKPLATAVHAAAHGKEAGKQLGSKHTAEAVTKAQHEETEFGGQGAPPVILGRVGNAGGANASSAAASRYGKAQQAPLAAAQATEIIVACHSPDKLPPSKRHAAPITSPSKRARQERNITAPPSVAQTGATARVVLAGGRGGANIAAGRSPISPLLRGAPASKSNRSQSANTRRPRSSVPGNTAAEHRPLQTLSHFTQSDAGHEMPAPPPLSPASAAEPTVAQTQLVPKLSFENLAPCKSPMGTPHLRGNPSAAVAADMVPLRQQPVSIRSPVPLGSMTASAWRPSTPTMSGTSPDAAVDAPPPDAAVAASQAIYPADKEGADIAELHRQMSGQVTARDLQAELTKPAIQPAVEPQLDGAGGKTRATNNHGATGAVSRSLGDGVRPASVRQSVYVPVVATTHAAAMPRSLSARPGAIHKPLSATGAAAGSGMAASKATTAAAPLSTHTAAAGGHKAAAAPPLVGTSKSAKAAAAVASTTAAAPKVRSQAEDNKNAPRQAPRNGTMAAGSSARVEAPGRSSWLDGEQDRVQRRRQYEALLGRTGPGSLAQEPAAAPVAAASADAPVMPPPPPGNGVPAPAGKVPLKPPAGSRTAAHASAPHPERLPARKSAPSQPNHVRTSRQVTGSSAHGGFAAQQQRGKVAQPAVRLAVCASGLAANTTGSRLPAARGRPDQSAAADVRLSQGPIPDTIAVELQRKDGQLDVATDASSAPPENSSSKHLTSLPAIGEGQQEAAANVHNIDSEEGSTPTHPKDLSWLVDASPYTSLAETPGALTAVRAFAETCGFGFGAGQEDDPPSGTEPVPSASFHGFGASPDDAQHPRATSSGTLGEGDEAAGPFGVCHGDATVMVRRQPVLVEAHPVGLPPTGLAAGLPPIGLAAGGLGSCAVPSSVFSIRSVPQLTPGPGTLYKLPVAAAANRAKAAAGTANNNGATPAVLPQAKLRFSWDPAAAGATPAPPGAYACPSPGMADSFLGFGMPAVQEATPVSIPNPNGFGAVAMDRPEQGDRLEGAGGLGDAENSLDQGLGPEVPVPMQCTSPNTPAPDAFEALVLGGGADEGDKGVVMYGGGAGGIGRAGRVVEDSYDALRISSMSSWPMLRDREAAGV